MAAHGVTPTLNTGVHIAAAGLSQRVRRGRQTLREISLAIEPGQLVAIIGASGAGKTTLLEALAGVRQPTAGSVHYDGVRQSARTGATIAVGYVPQDDIIHRELPLERTLRYAARLRLPSTTPSADITRRVTEVMAELGLTARATVPVGRLSGGERKRASIAVELLTRPRVFFLDEPTSGLDPAIAVELLRVLRRLAESSATVVLTTHQIADVELCDRVVVLTRQGSLAFVGTPEAAREFFAVRTLAEVYLRLDERPEPDGATAVPPTNGIGTQAADADTVDTPTPPASGDAAATGTVRPSVAPRPVGRFRQWLVLTGRSVDIVARNRLTLAILLGSPLLVLGMFALLFRPGAFDLAAPSPNVMVMILFWIAFGGFFFGLTYGLLQICTEFAILRRERLAGVRIAPYLIAKVTVLLPLLALVDLALLGVLRAMDRLPAVDGGTFASLYATLLLSSAAALTLGLLCSAAVTDAAQATLLLPMLCFPQVLFVGAILPVPAMAAGGQWISYAMSNRWAFEGLGHTAELARIWRDGNSPLGPPLLATYGDSFARPVWGNWLILAGFTLLFLAAAWGVLVRKGARGAA